MLILLFLLFLMFIPTRQPTPSKQPSVVEGSPLLTFVDEATVEGAPIAADGKAKGSQLLETALSDSS